MALKLSLKPGERFAINGAVMKNGDRRTVMIVETEARLLREGDILQSDAVRTPATRVYFPIMMMYLEPAKREEFHRDFASRLTQFIDAVDDPEIQNVCLRIGAHVANRDYYKALTACRTLMTYEEKMLSHVA
ncbi:MAG: flagellar biosynthesis repressor FlbT [Pseudomonadota bacterium]